MCTVTYIPKGDTDFILTSSRDENINRAKALSPRIEKIGNVNILFPKDGSKGGTWIGVTDKNRTLCLLNGAFNKHILTNNYIKSRGLIVLDFFQNKPTNELLNDTSLKEIEPFTLIIINVKNNERKLTCLKWDGERKHIQKKDGYLTHIWSSSTLYNTTESLHKESEFKILKNNKLNSNFIINFHENGTLKEPFLMKYNHSDNPIKTVSITQIEGVKTGARLSHKNLIENTIIKKEIIYKN